jgi:hypothetical protein
VREVISGGQPLPYDELLVRTRRFLRLVVVRPDGYASGALTGKPLARLGPPTLYQGELYVQGLRVGAFHFDDGGVFFAVDESLQPRGLPVGERPLGRDPATAALLGAEDALEEIARGLAAFILHPVRTLGGLAQLPSALKQAKRQVHAAKGTPIQWHFAEREVAELMRALFREEKLRGIKVIHTPASP